MPTDRLSSGFDSIRPWRGSTARGFEELCYQLFKSDAPEGSRAIRTASPDGGVEWYATLPDGSEEGWQAKHVHDVDSLLNGLTESVRTVVRDRPRLTKLTFLISSNLNTAVGRGRQKSQRQKYDDKEVTWRTSIEGAADLDFELIQESDILDRLALPEHEGRRRFWWGETEFTDAWLSDKLRAQVDAAGEKYRPELQVDLPIEKDLSALGFDDSALNHLERLRRAAASEAKDLWLDKKGPDELVHAYDAIIHAAEVLGATTAALYIEPSTVVSDLAPLRGALGEATQAINTASGLEYAAEEQWRKDHPDKDWSAAQSATPHEARGYRCRHLIDRISELERWLDSTSGRALQLGLYFLTGVAGSGKTHLLLESTHRALESGRPGVFLTAARFGRGDLWTSLCDQIGLPPLGADVLLGAMDAAGEASALTGRRFVIAIDALNETPDPKFWHTYLPALRAAVSQWPHVALVVSCRDTYLPVVCDGEERGRYVQRAHPGFAGQEVDATHKFFAFHGLQSPRVPLLVPEFSLPLFLKLFCEGLRDSKQKALVGHEGRITIFQRYLDAKLSNVARRYRPEASTNYEQSTARQSVARALDAILDEFAETGSEMISLARAESLVTAALDDSRDDAVVVIGSLQSEGVLNQELLYLDDTVEQGLRILFQALADYMILRRRLDRSPDPSVDDTVKQWLLEEASWGIIEAAAVVIPELVGIELPDLLNLNLKDDRLDDSTDRAARRREIRNQHIALSVVRSLPYREASAVTERTVELLNESLALMPREDLFRVMFLIAPQPEHRLNGNSLHRHLAGIRMPVRDEYFGFATYHELSEESSAGAVLARWASKGPYPDYDPQVIELAAIPLIWLLLSPNRFMRDWITKALVRLLRGHVDVMETLIVRFWPIDDPYVVQRVFVIAYGSLMWSEVDQRDAAKRLVARVRKLVFSSPVRADEILLDAARGILEWGVSNDVSPKSYLKIVRRPYGLKPPGPVASEEKLDEQYGWQEGQPDEERYSSVLSSVLHYGDFGRYVVEPGVRMFSRHPLAKPFPDEEMESGGRPTIVRTRWNKFVRSLMPDQLAQLDLLLQADPKDDLEELQRIGGDFSSGLTPEQSRLYWDSYRRPRRRRFRDDSYPADRAKRWIFMRVLRLGWTPERFGKKDRYLGQDRAGREAHKAERWGKKYQWIAYHELLARVADNFHTARRYSDHQDYQGLHQIIADREIDPSLPPIPFNQLYEPEAGNDTWRPSSVSFPDWPPAPISFQQLGGSLIKFLNDTESEPVLDRVMIVTDSTKEPWVLLDANIAQGEPEADKPWLGLQQSFWLNSWLVPAGSGDRLLPLLPSIIKDDRHDFIDSHGHVDCCYYGEIGWSPHNCYNRHADFVPIEAEGRTLELAHTVEDYLWEGGLNDCSINDSVSASLPSTFIRSRSALTLNERGPAFLDDGKVAFTNYLTSGDRGRGFLVRASWLKTFMMAHNLELVAASHTLRWRVTGDHHYSPEHDPEKDDRLDVYAAARIDPELGLSLASPIRMFNHNEDEG